MMFSILALLFARATAFVPVATVSQSEVRLASEDGLYAVAPGRTSLAAAAAATAGAVVVAAATGSNLVLGRGKHSEAAARRIRESFPGSVSNREFVKRVFDTLSTHGYGRDTLLCTSFATDAVVRSLETELSIVYHDNYHLGGLAGFPFAGRTALDAVMEHIPDDNNNNNNNDGGSCLVVFGPHVGVDRYGNLGSTERPGRPNGVPCCAASIAALEYLESVPTLESTAPNENNAALLPPMPTTPVNAQQVYLNQLLTPYAARLQQAVDKMEELPFVMYDAQKEMIGKIVQSACSKVPPGRIALLGGIGIITGPGATDFFMPLSLELLDNEGNVLEDLKL